MKIICTGTNGEWNCTLRANHRGDHAHIKFMPNGFPYTQAFWNEKDNYLHIIQCTVPDCTRPIGHYEQHNQCG